MRLKSTQFGGFNLLQCLKNGGRREVQIKNCSIQIEMQVVNEMVLAVNKKELCFFADKE